MAAKRPRNRIVVFRLSQDEFSSLKTACDEKGGHNLSEFTRTEVLTFLKSRSEDSLIERRFRDMDRKLTDLQATIRQVATILDTISPQPKTNE